MPRPATQAIGSQSVEALEISPDQQRLLIGFRSPLRGDRARIASIENPGVVFDSNETPRISPRLDELDLGHHGIRGLSWIPALGGYLVIGGPATREPANFDLWLWSGQSDAPAQRMTVPGLHGFEKSEGVSPAVIDGVGRIIFVSDDGNRKSGRAASHVLLDPAQLQTVS